jgi:peptidoglycan/LPS O-acetylase OafA/YrhL
MTNHSGRIPALDGVRGVATLTVIFSHFQFDDRFGNEWWWKLGHTGWLGVDLFFVLSGFLITGILMGQKDKPNYFYNFYRRRALRILPMYYFIILLCALAIVFIEQQPQRLWEGYDGLQWFVFFVPNFALALKGTWVYQTTWVGMSHLWSLAVEEQFYFIWPVVVWVLSRRWLGIVSAVIMLTGGAVRVLTDLQFGQDEEWTMASYVLPHCRFEGLAAGSLLAVLAREGWLTYSGWQRVFVRDLAFSAGMVAIYLLVGRDSQWRGTFVTLAFAGFTYLALTPSGLVSSLCNHPWMRHIGLYSYALYVFHQAFREPFKKLFRFPLEHLGLSVWTVQILYMLLAGAATYGLARLSWWLIEKPFLDKK